MHTRLATYQADLIVWAQFGPNSVSNVTNAHLLPSLIPEDPKTGLVAMHYYVEQSGLAWYLSRVTSYGGHVVPKDQGSATFKC